MSLACSLGLVVESLNAQASMSVHLGSLLETLMVQNTMYVVIKDHKGI